MLESIQFFSSPEEWMLLFTLTVLEIILGIDNVIFIALLVEKLPKSQRKTVRQLGISLALLMRVVMLFGATTIAAMTEPLFFITPDFGVSGRDLLLFFGGLFLVVKGSKELWSMVQNQSEHNNISVSKRFWGVVFQVIAIDFVFSFDSVITAVGMTTHLLTIVLAVSISMVVMLMAIGPIGGFIERHPSLKVIAIAFVWMIGAFLISESLHWNVDKGYLYMAVFFSTVTEYFNILIARKRGQHR
jgi:predicted tellurium resistance membrane protein TerC